MGPKIRLRIPHNPLKSTVHGGVAPKRDSPSKHLCVIPGGHKLSRVFWRLTPKAAMLQRAAVNRNQEADGGGICGQK